MASSHIPYSQELFIIARKARHAWKRRPETSELAKTFVLPKPSVSSLSFMPSMVCLLNLGRIFFDDVDRKLAPRGTSIINLCTQIRLVLMKWLIGRNFWSSFRSLVNSHYMYTHKGQLFPHLFVMVDWTAYYVNRDIRYIENLLWYACFGHHSLRLLNVYTLLIVLHSDEGLVQGAPANISYMLCILWLTFTMPLFFVIYILKRLVKASFARGLLVTSYTWTSNPVLEQLETARNHSDSESA